MYLKQVLLAPSPHTVLLVLTGIQLMTDVCFVLLPPPTPPPLTVNDLIKELKIHFIRFYLLIFLTRHMILLHQRQKDKGKRLKGLVVVNDSDENSVKYVTMDFYSICGKEV